MNIFKSTLFFLVFTFNLFVFGLYVFCDRELVVPHQDNQTTSLSDEYKLIEDMHLFEEIQALMFDLKTESAPGENVNDLHHIHSDCYAPFIALKNSIVDAHEW